MSSTPKHQFPASVVDKLLAYVYALFDPRSDPPTLFYIGKGNDNRVFAHAEDALESPEESDKIDVIRSIHSANEVVHAVILRHGMTDAAAYEVESTLIDFCRHVANVPLTNVQGGHGSQCFGAMTPDEVIRKYEAAPLELLGQDCVLININRTYRRAKGALSYYQATKESWKMDEARQTTLRYALSEYRGFVVEVFEIREWYKVHGIDPRTKEPTLRWGFNGAVAPEAIRARYVNHSIKKKRGAANPLRYNYKAE